VPARMIFAPTRDIPLEVHAPAVAPRHPEHVAPPTPGRARRLMWRAVVHVRDRDTVQTTWHLAGCNAPLEEAAAHCPAGQLLLERVGDPDGHCLIDGTCGRCQSIN
jgi:hypothetical protein